MSFSATVLNMYQKKLALGNVFAQGADGGEKAQSRLLAGAHTTPVIYYHNNLVGQCHTSVHIETRPECKY